MVRYGAAVFLSAFLLFSIQPLIGKALLPWFGGSASVWTTCLVFFQLLLLAGYAWAHRLQRWAPRAQVVVHGLVVMCAVAALGAGVVVWGAPVLPGPNVRPLDSDAPMLRVSLLLAMCVGAPYFTLATTGPLLQSWFSRASPHASPWRLYALSNVGSLLALVSYPFVVEPLLTLRAQAWAWAGGFFALVLVLLSCASTVRSLRREARVELEPLSLGVRTRWAALAALPSLMLLAVTNHLCEDVAVIPFLWVLPLALYLLTFILCFESDRWYSRARVVPWLGLLLVIAGVMLVVRVSVVAQVVVFSALVSATGMVCHGELAARRPAVAQLTSFYLAVSAGGALGGICVGLVAPWLFDDFFELDVALLLTTFVVVGLARDRSWLPTGRLTLARLSVNALTFVMAGAVVAHVVFSRAGVSNASRSFYGTVRILRDQHGPGGRTRVGLLHGASMHGFQVEGEPFHSQPTSYFTPRSGIARAVERLGRRLEGQPISVGVIGLGIGTLAVFAKPGDEFRFYELSPDVVALATSSAFTYLSNAGPAVTVLTGDGRLLLEREERRFDLFVMDAFSSNSVPVHLLTREAFAVSVAHLRDDRSLIAVNVLNRTLDLAPLVFRMADELHLAAVHVVTPSMDGETMEFSADWMVLSPSRAALEQVTQGATLTPRPEVLPTAWTDDFSNVAGLVRLNKRSREPQ